MKALLTSMSFFFIDIAVGMWSLWCNKLQLKIMCKAYKIELAAWSQSCTVVVIIEKIKNKHYWCKPEQKQFIGHQNKNIESTLALVVRNWHRTTQTCTCWEKLTRNNSKFIHYSNNKKLSSNQRVPQRSPTKSNHQKYECNKEILHLIINHQNNKNT